MTWWSGNTLRLVQNNLREIDADMDVDLLMRQLKDMGANALMMNAGGIFAFHPSKLQYQYVTPYLKKDLLGEAVGKAHENGMRFIARFDFSKAHESIYKQKPEWFYRSKDGREVNYFGIVHTCLNGEYQQRYSLDILSEVLMQYDVDGVFFNMFGYQNWDYSGNYYGICYCDSCSARFNEMYGLELPENEDRHSEHFRKYREFQELTSVDILEKIHAHIKHLKPDAAISTYHPHKVDIVRHESNTALNRSHPKWLYSAAENIMPISGSYDGKLVSNCSINAIDLTYRFTGVSRYETEVRLYESIANGSGLDFCIIGAFEGYPDKENLQSVANVFQFHKRYEHLFGKFHSMADVVLIKPASSSIRNSHNEYLGIFKMLKEAHITFDVIKQERLEKLLESPARMVILPGIEHLPEKEIGILEASQRRGMSVMATGGALASQEEALRSLFSARLRMKIEDTTASYVQIDDKEMFPELEHRDWVIVNGAFAALAFDDGVIRRLPYVDASSFGPPERAYGHQLTEYYGLGIADLQSNEHGFGAYIAWNVGELYHAHGFADHKQIVLGTIDCCLRGERILSTSAHPSVEITFYRLEDGSYMLQLLNLSGFNGVTYEEPLPMNEIKVKLTGIGSIQTVHALEQASVAQLQQDGRSVELLIPRLETFAAYHLI